MNTQITTFEFENVGAPTRWDEAGNGSFSWAETLLQPEDPFFAYSPLATFGDVQLVSDVWVDQLPRSEPGRKDRFGAL
jgi:hypothetical protein